MSSGDWIAVAAIVVTILIPVVGGLLRQNATLKAESKAKDALIAELKLQNAKLEITGTLVNRFFSQLPNTNEIKREIQP